MKTLAILAVAVSVAVAFSVDARAGAIPTLTIDASSNVGGDVLHLTPTLIETGAGTFTAHVEDSTPSFSLVMDLQLHADPVISGSFSLTNLSGVTQTFSVSASMSTSPFGVPSSVSGSFGDATYTDADASSSVAVSSAVFYRAMIDATVVRDLGNFNQSASGGPGISGTISQLFFPPPPTSGPAGSSISVSFPGFSITAGDKIETPFDFSVVPEPGFASLFAVGLAVFLLFAGRTANV